MIAKAIPAKTATSSIARLTQYISGLQVSGDPAGWPALADYILDAQSDGAKVSYVRMSNLYSDELGPAVKEIMLVQEKNTRAVGDKNYHLVISFPHGEIPNKEQLDDIEDKLVEAIGLGEHQRVSAAHDDKDHYHLHVAINKVHPVTFRNISPSWDHPALMKKCEELEIKHGLIRTNHERGGENAKTKSPHEGTSFKQWILDKAHDHILAAINNCNNWQEFNQAIAKFDIVIRPRGSGLVIASIASGVHVKASSINRALSHDNLVAKFGAFKQSKSNVVELKAQYEKPNRQVQRQFSELFQAYQKERNANLAVRKQMRDHVTKELSEFLIKSKISYAEKKRIIKNDWGRHPEFKLQAHKNLALEKAAFWKSHKENRRARIKEIDKANPLITWHQFLQRQVERGDENALAALRQFEQKRQRLANQILTADSTEAARNVIFKELAPKVIRNGDLHYICRDGGRLTDNKHQIKVDDLTTGAAFLALSIAAERFGDRPLVINGSDEFKAEIAKVANIKGLKVTFKDKAMEELWVRFSQLSLSEETSKSRTLQSHKSRGRR